MQNLLGFQVKVHWLCKEGEYLKIKAIKLYTTGMPDLYTNVHIISE